MPWTSMGSLHAHPLGTRAKCWSLLIQEPSDMISLPTPPSKLLEHGLMPLAWTWLHLSKNLWATTFVSWKKIRACYFPRWRGALDKSRIKCLGIRILASLATDLAVGGQELLSYELQVKLQGVRKPASGARPRGCFNTENAILSAITTAHEKSTCNKNMLWHLEYQIYFATNLSWEAGKS